MRGHNYVVKSVHDEKLACDSIATEKEIVRPRVEIRSDIAARDLSNWMSLSENIELCVDPVTREGPAAHDVVH